MKKIEFLFILIGCILLGIFICFEVCKNEKIDNYNRCSKYIELYEKNQNKYNFTMEDVIKYNDYKNYIKDFTLKNNYIENFIIILAGIFLGTFAYFGFSLIYTLCETEGLFSENKK